MRLLSQLNLFLKSAFLRTNYKYVKYLHFGIYWNFRPTEGFVQFIPEYLGKIDHMTLK